MQANSSRGAGQTSAAKRQRLYRRRLEARSVLSTGGASGMGIGTVPSGSAGGVSLDMRGTVMLWGSASTPLAPVLQLLLQRRFDAPQTSLELTSPPAPCEWQEVAALGGRMLNLALPTLKLRRFSHRRFLAPEASSSIGVSGIGYLEPCRAAR
jgi:hypothetical protein